MRLFARRFKILKTLPKSKESRTQKTTKNEHASNTPTHQELHQKIIQNSSKMAPRRGFWGVREPLGRRVGAKSFPKSTSEASGAQKKIFGRGRGRPKTISQQFLAPLKTDTPPRYGGVPGRSAPRKIAFLLKILAPASAGCKNRGSWVLGGHSREKLKLLSTTSKLVV